MRYQTMEISKKVSVLFCFSAFFFLLFTINQTMSKSNHMDTFCMKPSTNSTANTTYNTNLNTLLSILRKRSSLNNYYNLTTGLASDTVHGMFLCTGDVDRTACKACVKTATIEIAKNCTNHREAIIYYFDCMVRYSDKYFLSTLETNPNSTSMSCNPIPKSFGKFGQILSDKMEEAIVRSLKFSSSRTPYYLMDTSSYDGLYDLESIVQCTPHLDHKNCTKCLKLATQELTDCCNDKLWGLVSTPKCFVSFATSYTPTKHIITLSTSSFSIRGSKIILGGTVFAVAASVFALMGL